jgi:hypothetical protein
MLPGSLISVEGFYVNSDKKNLSLKRKSSVLQSSFRAQLTPNIRINMLNSRRLKYCLYANT